MMNQRISGESAELYKSSFDCLMRVGIYILFVLTLSSHAGGAVNSHTHAHILLKTLLNDHRYPPQTLCLPHFHTSSFGNFSNYTSGST